MHNEKIRAMIKENGLEWADVARKAGLTLAEFSFEMNRCELPSPKRKRVERAIIRLSSDDKRGYGTFQTRVKELREMQ